jgi:hypothetical protein
MKLAISLFILVLVSCTSVDKRESRKPMTMENDNRIVDTLKLLNLIDSIGAHDLYTEAKWRAYTYKCDDTVRWRIPSKIDTTITMSALDITLRDVKILHDTIEFYFNYAFGSLPFDFDVIDNCKIKAVGFKQQENKVLYYISDCGFSYKDNDSNSRFTNPIQPEVISFIKNHKSQLNPWFKDESEKRGIISN